MHPTSQVQLVAEGGITSMAWSCEKFKMEEGEEVGETNGGHVLAVALGNGEIVLLRGHDDVSPVRVKTGLRGTTLAMEWANSRELLAVAGTLLPGEICIFFERTSLFVLFPKDVRVPTTVLPRFFFWRNTVSKCR